MTLSDLDQQLSSLSSHPQVLQSPKIKRLFDDLQEQLAKGEALKKLWLVFLRPFPST